MFQKQTGGFLGFLLVFLFAPGAWAQDPVSLQMIFELLPIDDVTIGSKTIEAHCSKFLSNRKTESPERIVIALKQRAFAYLRMQKVEDAKKDFDDLCNIKPKDPDFRCYLAATLLTLKHYEEAYQEAREAIRLDPKHAAAHTLLGDTLWKQGNQKGAIDSISKAISLDPKYAPSFYIRALYLEAMQVNPARVLEDLNRFLELAPYDQEQPARPYYTRGMCLLFLNRPKEALASFLVGHKLQSNSAHVAEGLARAYADLGKFHLAAHFAKKIIKLVPEIPAGYVLSAEFNSQIGKIKEANLAIEKLLTFPRHPKIFWDVGKANFQMGRYDQALVFFDKGLELEPEHFECTIGKAHLRATCPNPKFRNGDHALKLASKAYKTKEGRDWEKWEPAMVVAEAHAECGNFKEAVQFAKEALERAGPDFGRRDQFLEKLSLFEKKMPYREKIPEPMD
jgi:tetratricopeptide (TPR) repeat protein